MQPLGTKVYLLKRYSPSDSFCTFFFWESEVGLPCLADRDCPPFQATLYYRRNQSTTSDWIWPV